MTWSSAATRLRLSNSRFPGISFDAQLSKNECLTCVLPATCCWRWATSHSDGRVNKQNCRYRRAGRSCARHLSAEPKWQFGAMCEKQRWLFWRGTVTPVAISYNHNFAQTTDRQERNAVPTRVSTRAVVREMFRWRLLAPSPPRAILPPSPDVSVRDFFSRRSLKSNVYLRKPRTTFD